MSEIAHCLKVSISWKGVQPQSFYQSIEIESENEKGITIRGSSAFGLGSDTQITTPRRKEMEALFREVILKQYEDLPEIKFEFEYF